jgi:hypothetical protein
MGKGEGRRGEGGGGGEGDGEGEGGGGGGGGGGARELAGAFSLGLLKAEVITDAEAFWVEHDTRLADKKSEFDRVFGRGLRLIRYSGTSLRSDLIQPH